MLPSTDSTVTVVEVLVSDSMYVHVMHHLETKACFYCLHILTHLCVHLCIISSVHLILKKFVLYKGLLTTQQ